MKIRANRTYLILVFLISICTATTSVYSSLILDKKVIYTTGTIVLVPLEGGFYGIEGDDYNHYEPINLPKDFKINGIRVIFNAIKRDDLGSFRMWGFIIQIINIKRI